MMNYNEFVKAYLGRATDYDGVYGAQCVDLIKLYLRKVWDIRAGSWGNAKYYWINFEKHPELTNNFTKIPNSPSFIPQAGDIVVWNGKIGRKDTGHIAIATGKGNTHFFHSYDQNWGGPSMRDITHSYRCVYGVLRPKDQSKITPTVSKPLPIPPYFKADWTYWSNGSTPEKVYKDLKCTSKVGSLNARERAWCYFTWKGAYGIVYNIPGGHYKAAFTEYAGKVKYAPDHYRWWYNGGSSETVYADTTCKTKIGTIFAHGKAYCYDYCDGMYLVMYATSGGNYKIGFVKYHG